MLNVAAARTLAALADILPLVGEFGREHQAEAFDAEYQRVHDVALDQLVKLELAVDEAKRERSSFLSGAPDPEPIIRGLRRLRADIIMVGRATAARFPEEYHGRLAPALTAALEAVRVYFLEIARRLEMREVAPDLAPVDAAIAGYAREVDAVREQGLTRALTGDVVGRTFAVGFALEQLAANLKDLAARTGERARKVGPS
jgi:hypothetical protein